MVITAITGTQIKQDGICDLNDIQGRTPGLVIANFSISQPESAIRGIGTKEDGAAADRVHVYVLLRVSRITTGLGPLARPPFMCDGYLSDPDRRTQW